MSLTNRIISLDRLLLDQFRSVAYGMALPLFFSDNLMLVMHRMEFGDLQEFDGELLRLVVLDLLVNQYGLQQPLDLAWGRLLRPDIVYEFLTAVAKGYQIPCSSTGCEYCHQIYQGH
jgi:hypothetical protein